MLPVKNLFSFQILLFVVLLFSTNLGRSQTKPDTDEVSPADVEAKVKVWSSPALDAALQKVVLPLAEEAKSRVAQSEQARKQAAGFRDRTKGLPAKAAELRQLASKPVVLPDTIQAPPIGTGLDIMEASAARLRAAVEEARQTVADARDLPQQTAGRRKELNSAVTELNARLLKLRSDPPPADAAEAVELTEARSMARTAGITAAQAQLDAVQAEVAWLDAADSIGWPALTLGEATRQLTALTAAETTLTKRIEETRAKSAAATLKMAEKNQEDAPAALQPVLEQVTKRATENRVLVDERIPEAEAKLRAVEAETQKWLDLAQRTREKIRRLGASGVVGVELRQQRQAMPSPAELRVRLGNRQETLASVETSRLSLEEELAGLPPVPDGPARPDADANQARRDSLATLLQSFARYYNTLVRLEEAEQQLASVVSAQRKFIHENILWIPSAVPAGRESFSSITTSARWLGNGFADPSMAESWWDGLKMEPITTAVWVLFVGFLFVARGIGRRRIASLTRLAAKPDAGFGPTAGALLWTIVISLPWPVLIWALSLPWPASMHSTPFALAWSGSLQLCAGVLLALEFVRQPLCPSGLAEAHFEWPLEIVRQLRWQFRRLIALVLPCVLFGVTFRLSDEARHDPAERGCLILLLLAAAWWLNRFWRLGRKHAGLPARGIARLAWFAGHALSLLLPLVLAFLALRGYLYTAEMLTERLALSLVAGAGFLLARSLFFRWYAVHRRQLRSARARQLRESREAVRAANASASKSDNIPAGTTGSELPNEIPEDEITGPDIDETGQEMRGLVDIIAFVAAAAVAWAIWSEVLPAANTLANRTIDTATTAISETTTAAPKSDKAAAQTSSPSASVSSLTSPPASVAKTEPSSRRTTWFSLLLAAGAAVLTLMAAKRIPGAIQFVLTSQLTLDAGARFALSTVTRYAIIIAGVAITLNMIGISWASVQWLAAALTVGLGFGLQEIFANFFSGLIILIERPIRPGDVVTIDNITGSVSRIQIRATIIRAGDGKDYIVPNKEFVTGKLLNWTRTDTHTRLTIQVGVAYGTDPTKALALLAKVATDHPSVLKDPAPVVSFESFGDSAMILMLRYHVGTLEHRLPTTTDLNCAIVKEFAAAGIDMPFPHRDVNVISMPDGWPKAANDQPGS